MAKHAGKKRKATRSDRLRSKAKHHKPPIGDPGRRKRRKR